MSLVASGEWPSRHQLFITLKISLVRTGLRLVVIITIRNLVPASKNI